LKHIGSEGIAPPFLTTELDGGEWSVSGSCHFKTGERAPGTDWIGGWVEPIFFLISLPFVLDFRAFFPSEFFWNYGFNRTLVWLLTWATIPVAKPLPAENNTNPQETRTDINTSNGIRTHDPSVWAGKDISCLRPCDHRDQLYIVTSLARPKSSRDPYFLSLVRGYACRITGSRSDGFIGTSVTISLNHIQHSAIADLHAFQFTVARALGLSVLTSRLLVRDLSTDTITM
jgi:hypothetical protein